MKYVRHCNELRDSPSYSRVKHRIMRLPKSSMMEKKVHHCGWLLVGMEANNWDSEAGWNDPI